MKSSWPRPAPSDPNSPRNPNDALEGAAEQARAAATRALSAGFSTLNYLKQIFVTKTVGQELLEHWEGREEPS